MNDETHVAKSKLRRYAAKPSDWKRTPYIPVKDILTRRIHGYAATTGWVSRPPFSALSPEPR